MTDSSDWTDVHLGVIFPVGYEGQHAKATQNTLNAFKNLNSAIMRGSSSYHWRRYRFPNWHQAAFMVAARSDMDGTAGDLADELIRLARLVDEHLELAQANQDDG